jgi:hypothetical protein
MGVGVLEDTKLEHVPGTFTLSCELYRPKILISHPMEGTAIFSEDSNAAALAAYEGVDLSLVRDVPSSPFCCMLFNHSYSQLKRASGKHSEIILVPQPSELDPNDPLLWAKW